MTVAEICRMNDFSVQTVERALANMQEKGLITGFIPGNVNSEIKQTTRADVFK
jgi:hypothetical protein